jgi:hypothetical protein
MVVAGPDGLAVGGQALVVQAHRESEVGQEEGTVVGNEHVVGFEVPVGDFDFMYALDDDA